MACTCPEGAHRLRLQAVGVSCGHRNALFKTAVIRHRRFWNTVADVEFATLNWVDWFNHHRLSERLGYIPPVEFEEAFNNGHQDNELTA